jgi:alpha-glucoside transport system permease protein
VGSGGARERPPDPGDVSASASEGTSMTIKILNALIAIVSGVGGAVLLYFVLNKIAELLPGRWEDRIKPFFYIAPAFVAITVFLLYPAVRTVILSFANRDSTEFVGLRNYTELLGSESFLNTLFNTLLWIAIVRTAG